MNTAQSSGTSAPRPRRLLARFMFWSGVVLLLLGVVGSSAPGSDERLYTLAGCLVLAGLFVPSWPYRIASVLLIVYSISGVAAGRRRSIDFQHFHDQHALPQSQRS